MSILSAYRYFLLKKKSIAVNRQQRVIGFDTASKIGILWNEADEQARNILLEQIDFKHVTVKEMVFSDRKEKINETAFTRKNLNWLGFPTDEPFQHFIQTDFDLLLNLGVRPLFVFDALTALSVASFKVGWDMNSLRYLDLSVDVGNRPEASYLAEQMIIYIHQLNTK